MPNAVKANFNNCPKANKLPTSFFIASFLLASLLVETFLVGSFAVASLLVVSFVVGVLVVRLFVFVVISIHFLKRAVWVYAGLMEFTPFADAITGFVMDLLN
jgi:hypothetical protein